MKQTLTALIVEDSAGDAKLVLRELSRSGFAVSHTIAETAGEMRAALERQSWDVILCDYALPRFEGSAALALAKELSADTPFIFVSGTMTEEIIVKAMKSGARDYVMKGNLARLAPAIERELHEAQSRREAKRVDLALRESEHKNRHLFERLHDAAFLIETNTGRVIETNAEGEKLLGRTRCEILQMCQAEFCPMDDFRRAKAGLAVDCGASRRFGCDLEILRKDGTRVPVKVSTSQIELGGRLITFALFCDITERRQTEEALRGRERELRTLVKHTPDFIVRWDRENCGACVNPSFARVTGICEGRVITESNESLLLWEAFAACEDVVRLIVEKVRQVFADGNPAETEIYCVIDSKEHFFHLRLAPEFEPDGRVITVVGIGRDISALKEKEQHLRALTENSPDLIARLDRDFRHLYVNGAIERTFGVQAVQILGRPIGELSERNGWAAPEEIAKIRQGVERSLITGVSAETEIKLLLPAGAIILNVRIVPEFDPSGQVLSTLIIGRDITPQKRAEKMLRRSEADLQLALEAGGLGDWKWNIVTGEITWSARCKALYGLPPETAITYEAFLGIVHPEDRGHVEEVLKGALQSRTDYEVEKRLVWSDGSVHWNASRGRLFCDALGQRVLMAGVSMDITERKRTEEALQATTKRLLRQESALIALNKKGHLRDADIQTALQRITEIAGKTLDVARVGIWRYNSSRNVVRCVALYDQANASHHSGLELAVKDFPSYFQAIAECDVLAVEDAKEDAKTREFADSYLTPLGIISMLDAPVQLKGALDGVVCHEHIGPKRSWTSDERAFAIAIANSVSLALEEAERRESEKSLRRSHLAYTALVNTIDGIVWEVDAETFQFLFVSQKAEELLGYPTAQWLDEPDFWNAHIHPGDRDWAVNYCVQATRRKEDHDFQYRMVAADGRVVWLHDLVTVVTEADRVTKLRGIMVDITEFKRGEEALKLFRALIDRTNDAVEVIDPETGGFLDVNECACKIHGYTREEFLQLRVRDIEAGLDLGTDELWQKKVEAVRGAGFKIVDGLHRRKDGSTFPVEVNVNYIRLDRDYLVAVVRDITDRKRSEAALRDSQARTQMLVTSSNLGLWDWNLITNEVFFSPEWKQHLGYLDHEIPNEYEEWESRLHPEDIPPTLKAVKDFIEGRSMDYDVTFRLRHRDRSWRWILARANIVRSPEGKPARMMGCHVDITDRKQVETNLRESEQRFRQVTESIDEVFWLTDVAKNQMIYLSPAYEKIWGRSCESVYASPQSWMDTVHPEDRAEITKAAFTLQATGAYDVEYRIVRPEGQNRWIRDRAFPIKDSQGQVHRIAGVAEDITERKLLDAEVSRQAAFAGFNPNPVLELSADGKVGYRNAAAVEMIRRVDCDTAEEMLPLETAEIVQASLMTGEPLLRLEKKYGKRTLSWSFFPVPYLNVVHCYGGDVTERIVLEEQLRQSQKMDCIGQLAGGVAHDFNNILAVIEMQIWMLLDDVNLPNEAKVGIQEIRSAATRAANLTRQLLTFSRRELMQPRNVDICEIVGTMTKLLMRILGEDIALETRFAPSLPSINADPGMMEQVLMNLAINARDAMPNGGDLTITLEPVEIDEMRGSRPSDIEPGQYVCLGVIDSGCGIPCQHLSRIFEPFFTTKEIGKGTGLGLATVYGIVQQHHGWIEVNSEEGKGSSFCVYLPASPSSVKESPSESHLEIPVGCETVLLVEDEPSLRRLLALSLRKLGYGVLEAPNGLESLKLWKENRERIDLLFTDAVMPGGMSGLDLADRLRKEEPRLKVIISSGYNTDRAKLLSLKKEGFIYLQKPVQPSLLARSVRQCLDGK